MKLLLYSILRTIVWFLVPQANRNAWKTTFRITLTPRFTYGKPWHMSIHAATNLRRQQQPDMLLHQRSEGIIKLLHCKTWCSFPTKYDLFFISNIRSTFFERKINEMQKYNVLKMRFELHIVNLGSEFSMAIKIWTPFFAPLLSRSQSACHFQKSSRPHLTRMAHGICTSCPMPNTYNLYCKKKLPIGKSTHNLPPIPNFLSSHIPIARPPACPMRVKTSGVSWHSWEIWQNSRASEIQHKNTQKNSETVLLGTKVGFPQNWLFKPKTQRNWSTQTRNQKRTDTFLRGFFQKS